MKGKISKKLLAAGLLGWFFVLIFTSILSIQRWLPILIKRQLPPEISSADFEIEAITLSNTILRNLKIITPDLELLIPEIQIDHSPSILFKEKSIQSFLSKGLRLDLNLQLGKDKEASTTKTVTSSDILNSKIPVIAAKEILLQDVTINLQTPQETIFDLKGSLTGSRRDHLYLLESTIHHQKDKLHIQGKYDYSKDYKDLNFSFHIPDPISTSNEILDGFVPTNEMLQKLSSKSLHGFVDWNNQQKQIQIQSLLDLIRVEDIASVEQFALTSYVTEDLQTAEGCISIGKIEILDSIKAKIEGTFHINQLLGAEPKFQSQISTLFQPIPWNDTTWTPGPVKISVDGQPSIINIKSHELSCAPFPVQLENIHVTFDRSAPNIKASLETDFKVSSDQLSLSSDQQQQLHLHAELNEIDSDADLPYTIESILNVPKSKIHFVPSEDIKLDGFVEGNVQLNSNPENQQASAFLATKDLQIKLSPDIQLTIQSDLNAQATLPGKIPQNQTEIEFKNLQIETLKANADINGFWKKSPFSIYNFSIKKTENTEPHQIIPYTKNISASIETITWETFKIFDIDSQHSISKPMTTGAIKGILLDKSISFDLNYQLCEFLPKIVNVDIHTTPGKERTTLDLKTIFPEISQTFFSGILEIISQVYLKPSQPEISLSITLKDGKIIQPDNGLLIDGIQIQEAKIDDLLGGVGPSHQTIKINKIEKSPVHIQNVELIISPLPNQQLEINKCSFHIFDGSVELFFDQPLSPPYDTVNIQVEFNGFELSQITQLIPDFKEDIRGKIKGSIPLSLKNQKLSWKAGHAKLVEGESAVLRYSENGVIAQYMPEIQISKDLDIDINDALRDITLTQLEIAIQSSEQFAEPTVVIMSGHSNNPNFEVPIERIQLNIRAGDLPNLINETFLSDNWLNKIILKK